MHNFLSACRNPVEIHQHLQIDVKKIENVQRYRLFSQQFCHDSSFSSLCYAAKYVNGVFHEKRRRGGTLAHLLIRFLCRYPFWSWIRWFEKEPGKSCTVAAFLSCLLVTLSDQYVSTFSQPPSALTNVALCAWEESKESGAQVHRKSLRQPGASAVQGTTEEPHDSRRRW